MSYVLFFIFYFANYFLGNLRGFKPLLFVYVYALLAGGYGTYDTQIFYSRYNNPLLYQNYTEPGFSCIVSFFHYLHFTDVEFIAILSLFELYALFYILNRYCTNQAFFWSLFLIYPLLLFFTQLRFLLAFSVVLRFGLPHLLERKKFYLIKYCIAVLVAYSIHSSCIVFLVFPIALFLSEKKTILISLFSFVILSSFTYVSSLLGIFSNIVGEEKISIITNETEKASGNLGRAIMAFLMSFGMYLLLKSIQKRFWGSLCVSERDSTLLNLMIKIDFLCIIFIPLIYSISVGFYRISQALLIPNFIIIANYIGQIMKIKNSKKISGIILSILCISYVIYLFYSVFDSSVMQSLVLVPFFEENWILELFK